MIGELTNHLWQSTAFALLAGLLAVALRKNRAQVRYGLWLSASLKFLLPFSLLIGLGSRLEWAPADDGFAAQITTPSISYAMEQITQPFPNVLSSASLPVPKTKSWNIADRVRLILLSVWALGFATIAWVRLQTWRRIRSAVRASTPLEIPVAGVPTGVQVRSCPGLLEPAVVGLWRPLLLFPTGIIDRFEPRQLAALLTHELCHVRRRDNLTAALHMIVEAVFWFHPLVWWIGSRLVEERERACDEDVLRLGNDPQVYAEGILNVCKLYKESPLACMPGVTGSNLRKRVEDIMRNRRAVNLSPGRAVLLIFAGIAALAAPIAVGAVQAAAGRQTAIPAPAGLATAVGVPLQVAEQPPAQVQIVGTPARQVRRAPTQSLAPTLETFEVVSIRSRPVLNGGRGVGPLGNTCVAPSIQIDPRRLSISGISINNLIVMAYSEWADAQGGCLGVSAANLLSAGPGWVRSDLWDIEAVIPEGTSDYRTTTTEGPRGLGPITTVQDVGPRIRKMLQNLLADRFSLVLRSETRDMPVYVLTVGKDGFKSNGSPAWAMINGRPAALNGVQIGSTKMRTIRRMTEADGKQYVSVGIWKMTMPEIATSLIGTTERPVLDRTNLTGTFDFHLDYDTDGQGARPSIFKAIEEVGLKLETARAPVEVRIIERVEKPTEN
jgi:uncharacterized protein (TIGR03435 family)